MNAFAVNFRGVPLLGEVSEWFKVPVSKTGVQVSCTVGSNPTLSATTLFLLCRLFPSLCLLHS